MSRRILHYIAVLMLDAAALREEGVRL